MTSNIYKIKYIINYYVQHLYLQILIQILLLQYNYTRSQKKNTLYDLLKIYFIFSFSNIMTSISIISKSLLKKPATSHYSLIKRICF
jgi:hypothetical protein